MRFGLIIRGQYPQGDDMRVRLQEDLDERGPRGGRPGQGKTYESHEGKGGYGLETKADA